jgi:hypothetical protein
VLNDGRLYNQNCELLRRLLGRGQEVILILHFMGFSFNTFNFLLFAAVEKSADFH